MNWCLLFFFNDPATTEIYTLSLHDALPIFPFSSVISITGRSNWFESMSERAVIVCPVETRQDRKSTRLNSSHPSISYAVFCLKKKKKTIQSHILIILTYIDTMLYTINSFVH